MMTLSLLLRRYAVAPLAPAAALLLARLFGHSVDSASVYLLLALGVLAAARIGGRGPAVLATLLGLAVGMLLAPHSFEPAQAIAPALFLVAAAAIAVHTSERVQPVPPGGFHSHPPSGVKGATVALAEPAIEPRSLPADAGPIRLTNTLETVRQERDAERRLRLQLAELHEVGLQLSALSSRDELCRQAVEWGRERLGFDRMGLWLELEEPEVIYGTFGTDEQGHTRDERGVRLPIHVIPLAAQLLDGSARVLRRDDVTLYGDHGNPVGRGTHVQAGLWEGDRFLGFLSADNLIAGRPISEQEAELLGLYAAAIGHLYTRLQAEEALRESRDAESGFCRQLAVLHDISLELSTAPDFDTLCRRAVELGRSRLGFDRLGLWFRTDQPDEVRGSFGTDETGQTIDEREARLPVLPGTASELVLSGKERVGRLDETLLFTWQGAETRGTQMVAGLWNGQQAIGYLSADNRLWHQPFSGRQQALLELYAAALGHLCTLKQREDALREADQHKDQSLAMLAHELRNPLAPIKNAVELLKAALGGNLAGFGDTASPASERLKAFPLQNSDTLLRAAAVIERQVNHQSRLLDDLLDLSRIGQGKIELQPGRLDLVRLTRDVVEDRRGVLEAAGLTLGLALPDRPVWVEGDATRLTQVVGNLLANAGKFTPRGGRVTVALSVAARSKSTRPSLSVEHPAAILTVTDTGIGIEAELLPRVFDAFAQAPRSMPPGQAGLGLGLALVRGLVERHGGQVIAESDGPGLGACFTVALPLAGAPVPTEPASPRAPVLGGPLRILIIEDHPDAAETLRELLELFGCTVEVAHTGPEGIERAPHFRPEVVLCDLGLPLVDGYAVATALRALPEAAHARLIALSGHVEDQRAAREAGFDLHLTKPIDFSELRQLLEVAPVPRRS
jgi:signal transduction histidine kinase/CheY-like chemotaxis protein